MPANLILYYLITISTPITNILTIFIALISLSLYPFNNSFTSDLSDKKIEIDSFPEYDIFIVFTVQGTFSMRLISMFNSNIRFVFDILSDPSCLINMNLFEVSIFFTFFLFTVLFLYRFLMVLVLFGCICYYYLYIVYQCFKRVYYFIYYLFLIFIYQCRNRSDKYN